MKHLIVETSSRCNLNCPMCIRQSWEESPGDMEPEVFGSLLPSFSGLESLTLTGYGESLLNPRLMDMVRLARKWLPAKSRINLTTNGTLFTPELIEEVLRAGLDGVALSMDSLHTDKFLHLRGGASLASFIECLNAFSNLRERLRMNSFTIGVSFVAMESTISELPRLIDFAAVHGVNSFWVNNLLPHTEPFVKEVLYDCHSQGVLDWLEAIKEKLDDVGVDRERFRHLVSTSFSSKGCAVRSLSGAKLSPKEEGTLHLARSMALGNLSMGGAYQSVFDLLAKDNSRLRGFLTIFQDSKRLAASRGIELNLPLLIPRGDRECGFIKKGVCFVTRDGWVRPCSQLAHDYTCFHYGRPKRVKNVTFGRVPDQDLRDVWESQKYREFRNIVEAFPFSPCGDCGLADGCGYIDFDADFLCDCNMCEQPCGDCLWSRGILQCP